MNIEELEARQDEIRSRVQEIDREHPGEELPEAKRSEWNDLNEEFERNEKQLSELRARKARVEELRGSEEHQEPTSTPSPFQTRKSGVARGEDIWDLSTVRASVSNPEEAGRVLRDRALVALEGADFAHERADPDAARAHVESLIRSCDGKTGDLSRHLIQTGSPLYRRAFAKALAGQERSPEEQRALSVGVGKDGGFAVPFTLDPTIINTSNGVVNPIRQLARVENMTTDTWKGVTSAGVEASYAKEAEEAKDNSPELGQPEVSAERAQAFIPYSIEVGGDWGSLETEMARLLQDAKDELEAAKFLTGDGADEPFGLLTGATEVVSTTTKEAFAVGDVYALKGALPARFKPNAAWLGNDGIFDRVRQFDTAGGGNLWARLAEDRPPELIGKPAYELSTMDSAVNAEEKKILAIGDFRYYLIAERLGLTVELIPHLFGENGRPTGQRGLYAIWRNGAKVLTKSAFRVLKVKKE